MLILCWINAVYDMTQVASFIFYLGVLIIIFTLCVYLFIVMSTITSQASHRVSSTSSSSSHQFSFMATFLYKVLFITCFSVYKASSFFFYLVFWIKAWPLSWFFLFSLIVMKKSYGSALERPESDASGSTGTFTTQPCTAFCLPPGKPIIFINRICAITENSRQIV